MRLTFSPTPDRRRKANEWTTTKRHTKHSCIRQKKPENSIQLSISRNPAIRQFASYPTEKRHGFHDEFGWNIAFCWIPLCSTGWRGVGQAFHRFYGNEHRCFDAGCPNILAVIVDRVGRRNKFLSTFIGLTVRVVDLYRHVVTRGAGTFDAFIQHW